MKFSFIVSQNDLNNYAQLSGDYNAIHQNGLVYGALILARIEAKISLQVITIEVQFIRPIFINQVIEVEIIDQRLTVKVKQKECIRGLINYQNNASISK